MTECADCDVEISLDDGCEHTDPPLCHGCEKDRLSAELSALRAKVAELESERDAARRDLEAAERDRDDLAMGVGCIRCSDLLPCEMHPRTRELVKKHDR